MVTLCAACAPMTRARKVLEVSVELSARYSNRALAEDWSLEEVVTTCQIGLTYVGLA